MCALTTRMPATPLHNSHCIRGIKNISILPAYDWGKWQLSGDGPPTAHRGESNKSAEIAPEVEFLGGGGCNGNRWFSAVIALSHFNIQRST